MSSSTNLETVALANNLPRYLIRSEENADIIQRLTPEINRLHESLFEFWETDFAPGLRKLDTMPLPPIMLDIARLRGFHLSRDGIAFLEEAMLMNRPGSVSDLEQWAIRLQQCPDSDPKQAAIRLLRLICAWMDVHGETWMSVFDRTVGDESRSAINAKEELDPQELSNQIVEAVAPIILSATQATDQAMVAGIEAAHATLPGGEGK